MLQHCRRRAGGALSQALPSSSAFAGTQLVAVREGSTRTAKIPIILKEDVEHVGSKGSLASVRAGFFRNFLYPQQLAIYATKHNLAKLEQSELEASKAKDEERRAEAMRQKQLVTIIARLTSKPVEVLERTVEGTSALYGSVTPRMICEAVRKQLNISLPDSRVILPEPIRTIGLHRVPLRLSRGQKPQQQQHDSVQGAEQQQQQQEEEVTFMSVLVKDVNEAPKPKDAMDDIEDPDLMFDDDTGDPDGPTKKKKVAQPLGRKERMKKGK